MDNRKQAATERRAMQILKKHQIKMPVKQVRKVLEFMNKIDKLSVYQYVI